MTNRFKKVQNIFTFGTMQFFHLYKKVGLAALLFVSSVFADIFDMNGLYRLQYGPNLSYTLSGNSPLVWGQWLSQCTGTFSFNWIEPFYDLPYGNDLDPNAAFLRLSADIDISPFYGGFRVGIGGRPLEMNPQIEARFLYEHYTYFDSNVEMTLASNAENGSIADSWNADWITNRIYSDESSVDFMQNFAFYFDLEYTFGKDALLGIGAHFTFVDISTEFEGKSFDYRRNIPVFSRDYIIDLIAYAYLPFTKNWAVAGFLNQYNTGNSKSSRNTYLKEPLSYTIGLLGPSLRWGDSAENKLQLLGGFWMREKKRFYCGRLSQQFLVHLQYQRNFTFSIKPVPKH